MFAQDFSGFHFELDWDLQATEWDWRGLDLNTEPGLAPSEDFWKKFEELPDLGEDLESLFDVDVNDMNLTNVLMNHDCMWAGTCLNKDHKPENKPPPPPPPVAHEVTIPSSVVEETMPAPLTPPKVVKKRTIAVKCPVRSGGTTTTTAAGAVVKSEPPRPETPPSLSESEEEERGDDKRRQVVAQTGQIRRTIQTSAFDHNYDKTVRPEDYGLQTPSDSEEEQNQSSASEEEEEEEDDEEEEIDVVSLTRDSLPTNPTREIRTQLQKKVATAITTNSLLSAKRAVSRRLKQTKKTKRKRSSSDEDDDDDDDIKPTFYTPQPQPRRNWRKTPKKTRFSDSEPDSERRSIHNNMERMRRIDLRNAFDDLKGLLPSLAEAPRAPKVNILKDATSYLHELRQKERTLSQHVSKLRSHQEELRSTLSRLRKTLAAIRNRSQNMV